MKIFSRWFRSDLAESLNRQLQEERDAVQYWQKEYGNKCAELVAVKELDAAHLQTAKCFIKDQEQKLLAAQARVQELEASAKLKDLALEQARARWKENAAAIINQAEAIQDRIECYPI